MTLHTRDKNIFTNDYRSNVMDIVFDLKKYFDRELWLPLNNRYKNDTVDKIKLDTVPPAAMSKIKKKNLAQYIGASSVLHCSDGWSFYSSALSALTNGDAHTALHMAYYAELRATMSILAAQGIGVFNNRHFYLNSKNSVAKFQNGGGTHNFAWDCLEEWAKNGTSGEGVGTIIRPYNISLNDWFHGLGGRNLVRTQASSWLREWGIDLRQFAKDRDARNLVSYRPTNFEPAPQIEAKKVAEFLIDLWSLCEPSSSSFNHLDRYLLRGSSKRIFKSRTGNDLTVGDDDSIRFVKSIVLPQTLPEQSKQPLINFIFQDAFDEPLILRYCRYPVDDMENAHWGVLSRAFLMLRMATGSAEKLFSQSNVNYEQIDFWKTKLGEERGLWPDGDNPSNHSDLWLDVSDAMTELAKFTNVTNTDTTLSHLGKNFATALNALTSCERVPLWSIRSS